MAVRWDAVDRLIDGLRPELVSSHGLGPLGARRLRAQGRPVPEQLVREERSARAASLVARSLLTRVRDAYDGTILVLKGPELANRYPDAARRFGDVDLLVADADAAHRALLAAGFRLDDEEWPPPGWTYEGRRQFHLQPLVWPGLALKLEIHNQVNWPPALEPPPTRELFEAAVESSVAVEGLQAPHPDHHAVLLAAHTWAEGPLHKVRDLVDTMVFVDDARRETLERLARTWALERPWSATLAAADWLFDAGPEPGFVRVLARHLRTLREPTVAEIHLQKWLTPFWLLPPRAAAPVAATALWRDVGPRPGRSWKTKRRQTARALRHPRSPKSVHARATAAARTARHAGPGSESPE